MSTAVVLFFLPPLPPPIDPITSMLGREQAFRCRCGADGQLTLIDQAGVVQLACGACARRLHADAERDAARARFGQQVSEAKRASIADAAALAEVFTRKRGFR